MDGRQDGQDWTVLLTLSVSIELVSFISRSHISKVSTTSLTHRDQTHRSDQVYLGPIKNNFLEERKLCFRCWISTQKSESWNLANAFGLVPIVRWWCDDGDDIGTWVNSYTQLKVRETIFYVLPFPGNNFLVTISNGNNFQETTLCMVSRSCWSAHWHLSFSRLTFLIWYS